MTRTDWHDFKAHELRQLAQDGAFVIVPVGSTEQHGPHLPVQVDALLVTEIARRAAALATRRGPTIVAPTVSLGLAEHHMSFGGTITLDFATFHAVLRCVCSSISRHGFRQILLLNGHGGNIAAMTVIVGEISREIDADIATATYWTIPKAAAAFEEILDRQQNVRHAGEAETSMMLSLRPDLVDADAMMSVNAPMAGLGAQQGVYRWRPIADFTDSGVLGAPEVATAEKGMQLLQAAGEALADTISNEELWAPA